jgi:hypothetical protein
MTPSHVGGSIHRIRQTMKVPSVLLLVFTAACAPQRSVASATPTTSDSAALAAATISERGIHARIAFLASDALQGRDTPSPGLEAAAACIAGEFFRAGLRPAGTDGFLQRWRYVTTALDPGATRLEFRSPAGVRSLRYGSDYYAAAAAAEPFTGGIVFTGRGLPAEEIRGRTLRQRLVAVYLPELSQVSVEALRNGAADAGAGGLLVILGPDVTILELAEAFAALPVPPRRSLIFLAVSGEEKGLLGSAWFADNPTVPIESIVANINVDMIGRNHPDSVVVIGQNYSSPGPLLHDVNARHPDLGMTVSDDLWPEQRFFFRSDHFNFARREVPAIFFFTGAHEDYHQPSDTAAGSTCPGSLASLASSFITAEPSPTPHSRRSGNPTASPRRRLTRQAR